MPYIIGDSHRQKAGLDGDLCCCTKLLLRTTFGAFAQFGAHVCVCVCLAPNGVDDDVSAPTLSLSKHGGDLRQGSPPSVRSGRPEHPPTHTADRVSSKAPLPLSWHLGTSILLLLPPILAEEASITRRPGEEERIIIRVGSSSLASFFLSFFLLHHR